jgi:hypothetical protein
MAFVKNFCRIVTGYELTDEEVIDFFDIVQSIVPTKILTGFSGTGEVVSIDVMAYTNQNQQIYEIVLNESIEPEDGDAIAGELANEFEFDFDFEASVEV